MRSIARRTAVGAALLLVMPVAVWISGWRWQPGEQSWLLKAAFWVTETVTQPWGVITHLILFGWFLWCLRFRIKAAIMLFAILAAAMFLWMPPERQNVWERKASPVYTVAVWMI